ncbi:ORF6N domain-containing protein [Lacrimispora defluvii]|uniref:ORF6N domain-containing protein n=1 Tax=Lacrimispora defluvii TaxID=2719233 RepID=A0ABX1VM47_9FIRM|nr:ORF6N domain-containing protein [Lacrimispora defluvii]NNJ28950.1 ORF6N domain-containing protein [Lacrimispora defluvii]
MEELKIIEYKNIRVLTTQQIAQAYQTEDRRVSENYNANKSRYEEGKQLAFLKLDSSNPNLLAVLYTINNGSLGSSTGWGVTANSGASFINVPAEQYAILIGSSSGAEVGNYKLMWNCSNPSGANAILNYTDDLSRVVLYYSNSNIMSNGTNIIDGLKWEDHETWYLPLGYSARDMSMSVASNNGVKGVYLGSFSSSASFCQQEC